MIGNGGPPLIAALICFAAYFGNVSMGAAGAGVFLGDVAEMLTLFASAILFVIGVIARETAAKSLNRESDGQSSRE